MDIRHAVGVKLGIPRAKLDEINAYGSSDRYSARERAALAFATDVVRDDRQVDDAAFARLAEHFSEPEMLEVVFVVGYQTFASTFAKAFRLAPQGFTDAIGRPR